MRKIALLITSALLLTGCTAMPNTGTSTGFAAFSESFTSAFNNSVDAIESGDFLYVREVANGLTQNSLFDGKNTVSVFESSAVELSCPFEFEVISSFNEADPVVPLKPFTPDGTAEQILTSMESFSKEATSAEWIVEEQGLYFVSEIEEAVNIVVISISEDNLIEYYMGLASNETFDETVNLLSKGEEGSWNSPNVAVFYSYGDIAKVTMSEALPMDAKWFVDNLTRLADMEIYNFATFENEQVDLTPIINSKEEVLLIRGAVTEDSQSYLFFNTDKSPYLYEGEQLSCSQ